MLPAATRITIWIPKETKKELLKALSLKWCP
jgi:hypothetical protein